MQHYTRDYYSSIEDASRSAARVVVPLVLDLVRPESVIDVGCGTGEWLALFRENGVEDVWGVDGDYVNRDLLKIPEERFVPADLELPLNLERGFDLVLSLEVAEHLPSSGARTFVRSLARLGLLIIVSAAIPYQGGENHVNERWQGYWAELFSEQGYTVIDPLRRKVWNDGRVHSNYAQNTLVYVRRDRLGNFPLLAEEYEPGGPALLSVVHPETYLHHEQEATKLHNVLV
jgi:SAM-dependent methyltransferase